jgi:hypothetical protein
MIYNNLNNFGYLMDNLPKDLFNSLIEECETSEKNNPERVTGLTARNITKHRSLVRNNKNLFNYVKNLIDKYNEVWPGLHNIAIFSNSLPFKFDVPWINYQKKGEYIPNHTHDGVYSYSIWIKIPTPSQFEFIYTNIMGGIYTQTIHLTSKDEGKIILFPSKLPHVVYPFNDSNETRLSISGNLIFDTSKVVD